MTGTQSISAPARSASCCQGTMLEWCSISVSTIRSPAPTFGVAPGAGDEVDRLGRVADEDHLAPVGGADVVGDRRPGALVGGGRLGRERVRAAVDVGVVAALVAVDRLDRGQDPLGAGAGVEVGERLAADLALERRERRPDPSIERRRAGSSPAAPCRAARPSGGRLDLSLIQP